MLNLARDKFNPREMQNIGKKRDDANENTNTNKHRQHS